MRRLFAVPGIRRMMCVFAALVMICGCMVSFTFAEGTELALEGYIRGAFTMDSLFAAAESALEDGMEAKQVVQEMIALADSEDALEFLNRAMDNCAAADSEESKKILAMLEADEEHRHFETSFDNTYEHSRDLKFGIHDVPEASDELKAAFSTKNAHQSFEPIVWTEKDFSTIFGKTIAQFKPANPRPAYACIVIKNDTQGEPTKSWFESDPDEAMEALSEIIENLRRDLDDDMPALTGNPQLASSFWIIQLKYPFYARYGSDGKVKGYNCTVTVTVQDAVSHQKIGEISAKEQLENTIYSWSNWIAKADIPYLANRSNYESQLMGKVRTAIQKERAALQANRPLTMLNAEKVVNAMLLQQTDKLNDAWQKAIYESGAKDIDIDGNTLTFALRSYDAKQKELGKYSAAEDKDGWLMAMIKNASAYDLVISVELENGNIPQKSVNKIKTAVQQAAPKARQFFGGQDFLAAMKDFLFPAATEKKAKSAEEMMNPSESFAEWYSSMGNVLDHAPESVAAAVFQLQKNQALNVKDGPHAMVLSCSSIPISDLLSSSARAVLDKQAYLPAEERGTGDVAGLVAEEFAAEAYKQIQKPGSKNGILIDIDGLIVDGLPRGYAEYFEGFRWGDTIEPLEKMMDRLPDIAALPLPKTGLMRGNNKGTTVNFKLSKDSFPTYIIMRDDNDEIVMACFALAGKTTMVHVPQGRYRIAWCSGPYWYGEEILFGDLGEYSKSETVEIKGANYSHTFTLESSADGDVNIYGATPADFQ